MRIGNKLLSIILALVLFMMPLANSGLADIVVQPSGEDSAAIGEAAKTLIPIGDGALTWAEGARKIASLLGYLPEDAADIDLEAYSGKISGLSADNDSVFIALLAENGYFDISAPIEPFAEMPLAQFESLSQAAFSHLALTQSDADQLGAAELDNVLVAGEVNRLSAIRAKRVTVARGGRLMITGAELEALALAQGAQIHIERSEIARVYVDAPGEDAYIRIDAETEIPVIIVVNARSVVIEGSGALGAVRALGDIESLTLRATGSVINSTRASLAVAGPGGEQVALAPDAQVDFALTSYIVSFVTDGTPVATQEIAPGGAVDFGAAHTELDGKNIHRVVRGRELRHAVFDALFGGFAADAVRAVHRRIGRRDYNV